MPQYIVKLIHKYPYYALNLAKDTKLIRVLKRVEWVAVPSKSDLALIYRYVLHCSEKTRQEILLIATQIAMETTNEDS